MNSLSADDALRRAVSCHQSGLLKEAEALYRTVLHALPDHPDANHNFGVLLMQTGQPRQGLPRLKIALQSDPQRPQYWFSYIKGLIEAGEFDAARAMIAEGRKHGLHSPTLHALESLRDSACRKNRELRQAHASGNEPARRDLEQLGILYSQKRYAEQERLARQLTEKFPRHAYAWKALGVALQMSGRAIEALAPMRQALECEPRDAEGHNNLATSLRESGFASEAEFSCRQALAIDPAYAEVHNNLGIILNDRGAYAQAEAACRSALAIKPRFPGALVNLGNALKGLSRMREAETAYRQALEINPQLFEAEGNLSGLLGSQGRIDEADEATRRALILRPDDLTIRSNQLFGMNYRLRESPEKRLASAREFGEIAARKASRFTRWNIEPNPERLHVGIVSGDLRKHPVGYFLEGVLRHLDRRCIRLTAFSTYAASDELTLRLQKNADDWISLCGLDDALAARRIHDAACHVLIDLSGHTEFNRLPVFAWRPAPLQATWLGYFATTGVAEIDYFLADRVGAPASQQAFFTEKLCYLPETRLCFTAPEGAPEPGSLPALATGALTFASFQALAKINDEVLSLWGRVLAAVPGSRLRLYNEFLADPAVRAAFLGRLERSGIPEARVELRGALPREEYFRAYGEIDLCLDTFPYPGGTTTCEALWMGVPTLALAGESLLSRQGASLLGAAGLPDWVVTTPAAYVRRALAVADDLPGLARLRASLRERLRVSPLFDNRRFAAHLAESLWTLWRDHCAKIAPIEKATDG